MSGRYYLQGGYLLSGFGCPFTGSLGGHLEKINPRNTFHVGPKLISRWKEPGIDDTE